MKISKIFHFLYFSVLSIPLISIPIFAIYSMNHEISGNSINTSGYEVRNKYETKDITDYFQFEDNVLYHAGEIQIDNTIIINNAVIEFKIFKYEELIFYDDWDIFNFDISEEYNSNLDNYISLLYDNRNHKISINLTNGNAYTHYQWNWVDEPYIDITNVDFIISQGAQDYAMYIHDNYDSMDNYSSSDFEVLEYVWNDGIVLDDEDIVSQFIYSEYNFMDKYLPMYKFVPFNGIYSWISNTFFTGSAPIVFTIFYQWFAYWLFVSLCWLIFDVLMYVPLVVHRWLDKGALE